jgi:NAD(P)-dependent dehydrogenase (short-subunit alcohol dehydrogenase family)
MIERKTAIITGAASGIGLETTKRFAADIRYNPIYAIDKNPVVNTIFQSSNNQSVIPLQIDVRDEKKLTEMLRDVVSKSGRIDVIVNAAGIISAGRRSTYRDKNGKPKQELIEMDEVNVHAPITIMEEAKRLMKKNNGGIIINITSSKHYFPDAYRLEYMNGKDFLSRLTKAAAKHYRDDFNVRLVDVQPGNTKTNIDKGIWTDGSNQLEKETVQDFNDWWRKKFGNDPKNVAEVIYKIAEGKINKTPVMVGFDAKMGSFLQMYLPIPTLRWNMIFFLGSYSMYQIAKLAHLLRKKSDKVDTTTFK